MKVHSHIKIDHVFTAFINPLSKDDLESYLVKLKETFHKQKIYITGWQIQHINPELPRSVKIVKDNRDFKKYLC
jgi:hypothetical protein